jgi:hypothetical protein
VAKLKLERPYFYSKKWNRFGEVLSNDSKRIVYMAMYESEPLLQQRIQNRLLTRFYKIYPDAEFITEQEYLFYRLKYE